jgi:hypothetical protein
VVFVVILSPLKTRRTAKKRTRIADKTNVAQNNRQLERVRHLAPSQHVVKAAKLAVTGHQSALKSLFSPALRLGSSGIEVLRMECGLSAKLA